MNESSPTITPILEKKTPGLSEGGKREFASEITIANKKIEELNTPEMIAKIDSNPALKEKILNKAKFIGEIALGLGIAGLAAGTMEDMGKATGAAEILKHLIPTMVGIALALKGVWDSNITGSPEVRQTR